MKQLMSLSFTLKLLLTSLLAITIGCSVEVDPTTGSEKVADNPEQNEGEEKKEDEEEKEVAEEKAPASFSEQLYALLKSGEGVCLAGTEEDSVAVDALSFYLPYFKEGETYSVGDANFTVTKNTFVLKVADDKVFTDVTANDDSTFSVDLGETGLSFSDLKFVELVAQTKVSLTYDNFDTYFGGTATNFGSSEEVETSVKYDFLKLFEKQVGEFALFVNKTLALGTASHENFSFDVYDYKHVVKAEPVIEEATDKDEEAEEAEEATDKTEEKEAVAETEGDEEPAETMEKTSTEGEGEKVAKDEAEEEGFTAKSHEFTFDIHLKYLASDLDENLVYSLNKKACEAKMAEEAEEATDKTEEEKPAETMEETSTEGEEKPAEE